MNAFFAQPNFFKRSISFLLIAFFLNVTLIFAEEPIKVAMPSFGTEKAKRIEILLNMTLEELHQVRIVPESKPSSTNISALKKTTCPQKNHHKPCK